MVCSECIGDARPTERYTEEHGVVSRVPHGDTKILNVEPDPNLQIYMTKTAHAVFRRRGWSSEYVLYIIWLEWAFEVTVYSDLPKQRHPT